MITGTQHEAAPNTKAMELVGIDADRPDPGNGVIVRDPANGEATGYMKEVAMDLYATKWLKELEVKTHVAGIRSFLPFSAPQGQTSIRFQRGEPNEIEALHKFTTTKNLPIRVYVAWSYDAPTRAGIKRFVPGLLQ